MRAEARLDLLETLGSLLFFGRMVLVLWVAESWFWPGRAGFALMTAVYAVKGFQLLRARCRPAA
ncbi:hypothetical protein [Streptomyces gardneri]|uniref:hypothetical protein n=1 Tax=Streptomyces gardneri TaxID=66892 RepID=UPI0035DA414C